VIFKYYHPEVELVKNLNFYNPNNTELNFRKVSLSNPKIKEEESSKIYNRKNKT